MILSPSIASLFGFQAFCPVAAISVIGAVICLFSSALASRLLLGRLKDGLMHDLASADPDRRALVLAELNQKLTEKPNTSALGAS